ncbi:MAG TPA: hypothetical protein VFG38_14430 [Pseudomonadales bacterium]|nr:hypothetical protein [Pseudomonadales bacterium]
MIRYARYAGLAVVFLWFALGGISHFTNVDFFLAIMPPYVPFPRAAVYVSGVFEILFAIGIVIPATRAVSGILLILLTLAVTPANVYMWQHPELYPNVAPALLSGRLVLQVLLLWLIWWSTRTPRTAPEPANA